MHSPDENVPTRFRAFPRLNEPARRAAAGTRNRFARKPADGAFRDRRLADVFDPTRAMDRVALALGGAGVLPAKEVFESFEFFTRIRKSVRSTTVADLYCGHGLVGLLFAVFERRVERVLCIDRRRPASHAPIVAALGAIAPWVPPKVEFCEVRLRAGSLPELPAGTGVVGVHACGTRTDRCLDAALAVRGPLAVLPCCHPERGCPAPRALRTALGLATAWEVDRTYRLTAEGYRVQWTSIPAEITHYPRILCAVPLADSGHELPTSSGIVG